VRDARNVEGELMTDLIAEIRGFAAQDAQASLRQYASEQRAQRAAKAEAEHKQRVKAAEPSWTRWRAQRELESLVREVAASKTGPTAEHRATYARLSNVTGIQGG
jgi:uncharacterized Zn finger protein